jgi:hypothetical protein
MFGTFSADDHPNEEKMAQYRHTMVPILDQQVRGVVSSIWMGLPPDRQSVEEVEREVRRLVKRALADLRDDLTAFGFPQTPRHDNKN